MGRNIFDSLPFVQNNRFLCDSFDAPDLGGKTFGCTFYCCVEEIIFLPHNRKSHRQILRHHSFRMLVAIGVNSEGYREIPGVAEGSREDKEAWSNFLRYLKERGLKGVKLVISDKAAGWTDALGDFSSEAQWQRCVVHWYRNAFNKHVKTVAAMLKAIHAQEDLA